MESDELNLGTGCNELEVNGRKRVATICTETSADTSSREQNLDCLTGDGGVDAHSRPIKRWGGREL